MAGVPEESASLVSVAMNPIKQLEQIEARMEQSFLHGRFDTFNQLLSDRLHLLKQARKLPDNKALFELARKQTERWSDVLGKQIRQVRLRKMQEQAKGGYTNGVPRSGRLLNRSL